MSAPDHTSADPTQELQELVAREQALNDRKRELDKELAETTTATAAKRASIEKASEQTPKPGRPRSSRAPWALRGGLLLRP